MECFSFGVIIGKKQLLWLEVNRSIFFFWDSRHYKDSILF